jgi:hypothetical protein
VSIRVYLRLNWIRIFFSVPSAVIGKLCRIIRKRPGCVVRASFDVKRCQPTQPKQWNDAYARYRRFTGR